ncbi:hypothetical protein [Ramlibacter sp.]|uniref:hypothetical protein n=1 Tax=Ramlibacter sp. TaxID=1917967 RepID=UPI002609FE28|nr:hypothetical protein [Ramlibacter sp.]
MFTSLSGCGLLRQWYTTVISDSLALRATNSLSDRALRGTVIPANDGLNHLVLRSETWISFRKRTQRQAQQVAYVVEATAAPAEVPGDANMVSHILNMQR